MDVQPIVEVKVLDERIHEWGLPQYQTQMAAAIDLHACIDAPLVLEPQSDARLISSGISIHIGDPNIAALIVPRSGLGHMKGLVVGNLVGLIDADYTGPVMISVWNRSAPGTPPVAIDPGDRIAQMIFVPVVRPQLIAVADFSKTSERGAGGFGSTGGTELLRR